MLVIGVCHLHCNLLNTETWNSSAMHQQCWTCSSWSLQYFWILLFTFSTHDCENQNPEAYHMCVWASVLCLVETTRVHIWNASADSEL